MPSQQHEEGAPRQAATEGAVAQKQRVEWPEERPPSPGVPAVSRSRFSLESAEGAVLPRLWVRRLTSGMEGKTSVLLQVTEFMVVCYSSSGK